ncbi:hypothetical protein GCM10008933_32280 [Paenibacillus motobuensis]|uniref:Uncharacterized protein n=1 Tax=Paenibacillus motobuensis TaxID=295324 RepID=A0ABP3IE44_9BACL
MKPPVVPIMLTLNVRIIILLRLFNLSLILKDASRSILGKKIIIPITVIKEITATKTKEYRQVIAFPIDVPIGAPRINPTVIPEITNDKAFPLIVSGTKLVDAAIAKGVNTAAAKEANILVKNNNSKEVTIAERQFAIVNIIIDTTNKVLTGIFKVRVPKTGAPTAYAIANAVTNCPAVAMDTFISSAILGNKPAITKSSVPIIKVPSTNISKR